MTARLRLNQGFTLVELLIVIVIIAILAAITIVAYNGMQARANNSSIVASANSSYKLLLSYAALNGKYPTNDSCLTVNTACVWGGGAAVPVIATTISQLATIGTVPQSVPNFDSQNSGIRFRIYPGATYNGEVSPYMLMYFLQGNGVNCGLSGVTNSGGITMMPSTSGYTSTSSSTTTCVITLPNP